MNVLAQLGGIECRSRGRPHFCASKDAGDLRTLRTMRPCSRKRSWEFPLNLLPYGSAETFAANLWFAKTYVHCRAGYEYELE